MGPRGNNVHDGGDSAASGLWCQVKRLQGIVVRLQVQKFWPFLRNGIVGLGHGELGVSEVLDGSSSISGV